MRRGGLPAWIVIIGIILGYALLYAGIKGYSLASVFSGTPTPQAPPAAQPSPPPVRQQVLAQRKGAA